jgi:hypothetical protein
MRPGAGERSTNSGQRLSGVDDPADRGRHAKDLAGESERSGVRGAVVTYDNSTITHKLPTGSTPSKSSGENFFEDICCSAPLRVT